MSGSSLLPQFRRKSTAGEKGFDRLQKEVGRVFDSFARGFPLEEMTRGEGLPFGGFAPRVDVTESDDQLMVAAELPGVPEDAIDISLRDNVLCIKGEKKSESEDKNKDYHVLERSYGMFERLMSLPFDSSGAEPDATFRDGVLHIKIAKPPKATTKARRIRIRPAD
jgi:HSP20 family protein